MTSAELRRIVGCGSHENCEHCFARRTLANHADALVALVEAVERWEFAADGFAVNNLRAALAAVHATGAP